MNKLYSLPRVTLGALWGFLASSFSTQAGVVAPMAPRIKKPDSDWSEMKADPEGIKAWNAKVSTRQVRRAARHQMHGVHSERRLDAMYANV